IFNTPIDLSGEVWRWKDNILRDSSDQVLAHVRADVISVARHNLLIEHNIGAPRFRLRATSSKGSDRKSTRLNSSHVSISYAVVSLFALPSFPTRRSSDLIFNTPIDLSGEVWRWKDNILRDSSDQVLAHVRADVISVARHNLLIEHNIGAPRFRLRATSSKG